MKKIFLLTCLAVSSATYSQELDEAYLQSLPESVREDVLNKIEAKEDLDKPVYRRASSFVDKDEDKSENNALFGSNFLMFCKHHLCQSMNLILILHIF